MDVLKRIGDIKNIDEAKKELHSLFNDQGYSDYMVVYLRLLTSGQLQKEESFYSCFIEGDRSVCNNYTAHVLFFGTIGQEGNLILL